VSSCPTLNCCCRLPDDTFSWTQSTFSVSVFPMFTLSNTEFPMHFLVLPCAAATGYRTIHLPGFFRFHWLRKYISQCAIFGQEGGIYRLSNIFKGLLKSSPRHLPSAPRENHGSKTAGGAVFVQITFLSRGCHLHFLRTMPNFFRLEMKNNENNCIYLHGFSYNYLQATLRNSPKSISVFDEMERTYQHELLFFYVCSTSEFRKLHR